MKILCGFIVILRIIIIGGLILPFLLVLPLSQHRILRLCRGQLQERLIHLGTGLYTHRNPYINPWNNEAPSFHQSQQSSSRYIDMFLRICRICCTFQYQLQPSTQMGPSLPILEFPFSETGFRLPYRRSNKNNSSRELLPDSQSHP